MVEAPGLDVPPVVLIEIIELVIDKYRGFYFLVYCEDYVALIIASVGATAFGVVLNCVLLNFVTHYEENDSENQEDDAEHGESNHGGAEGGDGSPSWKSLLLEPRVFKFFNFVPDLGLLFF